MTQDQLVSDLRSRLKENNVALEGFQDLDDAPDEAIIAFGVVVFCCDLKTGTQVEGEVNSDQVNWALEQSDDTDEFLDLYAKNCLSVEMKDMEDTSTDEDESEEDTDER